MSDPVWSQLVKAQDDQMTIDEAIAAAILAHETDPEAHQGEGESLQNHKSDEVIDHPANSVVTDKIPLNSITPEQFDYHGFYYYTVFDTIDVLRVTKTGEGNVFAQLGYLWLQTGETSTSLAQIDNYMKGRSPLFSNYDYSMKFIACVFGETYGTGYFGLGMHNSSFAGFKVSGTRLYACCRRGTNEYLTELTGIDISELRTYEVKHTHGIKTEFFVDGQLVHTETAYYTNGQALSFFEFYLYNTGNVGFDMQVMRMEISEV